MPKFFGPKKIPTKNIFLTFFIVGSLWFLYRKTVYSTDIIDELIFKPLIFLTPLFILFSRHKIKASSLNLKKPSEKIIILSVLVGLGLSLLQIVPLILRHHNFHIPPNFLPLIIATVGTAVIEEIFFRGFLLEQLTRHFSKYSANVLSSFLFSLIHIPIIIFVNHTSGVDFLIALYIIFASSILYGILYLKNKTLWSPIIAHYVVDILLLF